MQFSKTMLAAAGACLACTAQADAESSLPRWEAGLVAGGGRLADYPGAEQSHVRGLVAPVLFYRGPLLRIDRRGVRTRLFDSPDFELDLTGTGAFDARNDTARAGMPDLDYLFGIGPQIVYKGWRRVVGEPTLHLKARAIFSTDFHRLDERGATLSGELRWRFALRSFELSASLEPTWASRRLGRYFYQVEPAQATPARPGYAARAGYLGSDVSLTLSRRESRTLSWFVSGRALSLHGAANEPSPLLRSRSNFDFGAGLVWTPWQSAARAVE